MVEVKKAVLVVDDRRFDCELVRVEAIKWIKEIHADDFPLYPNKDVKLPWFGQCITLHGGDQIFAAKVVLQAFFNIKEEDLK